MVALLQEHLATGVTTVARCWAVIRKDGQVFGFTDHDCDLEFDGINFRANSGLSAKALQQTTGLSVDNSEALGALSHVSVTEEDIRIGRFDGAKVEAWLVNWQDVSQRWKQFSGSFGEIQSAGGGFRVELRGLTEQLNQVQGLAYQRGCTAVFGDARCKVNSSKPEYRIDKLVETVAGRRVFQFADFVSHAPKWFERGRLEVMDGLAKGLVGVIKNDRLSDDGRLIELWQALGAEISAGDTVRITVGCDKTVETCRLKFDNIRNFRGFPHIPGEDWLMSYPSSRTENSGGSLRK